MAALASSRYPARNGKLFVGATTSAAASPVSNIATFRLSNGFDLMDATAFGDTNKIKYPDLPDASGTYTGFGDIAGDTFYTAAFDGLHRKTYWYPDYVNAVGTFWSGTAFFDVENEWGVGDMAKISGKFSFDSPLVRTLTS